MNSLQQTWREASAIECRLYWEKVDAMQDLYADAVGRKSKHMMVAFYEQKERTHKLFSDIGFVVNKDGLFVKDEPDTLDQDHDAEFFDAVAVDLGRLMHAMRHGPAQ